MTAGPKLRHEFVGMMFAVTIGEVGLQAAALVTVSGYVVHGLGEAQPPTRDEIRAWVERE